MTLKRLECALFVPCGSKNALTYALQSALCWMPGRAGAAPVHRLFGAKKKPVRCVAGRAFVLCGGIYQAVCRWAIICAAFMAAC